MISLKRGKDIMSCNESSYLQSCCLCMCTQKILPNLSSYDSTCTVLGVRNLLSKRPEILPIWNFDVLKKPFYSQEWSIFKLPYSLTRNTTDSMKNATFIAVRRKMNIQFSPPHLYISLYKVGRMYFLNLSKWKAKRRHHTARGLRKAFLRTCRLVRQTCPCREWSIPNFLRNSLTNTWHSMKKLTFRCLLGWKMIILPNTHYLTHFPFWGRENVLSELGSERVQTVALSLRSKLSRQKPLQRLDKRFRSPRGVKSTVCRWIWPGSMPIKTMDLLLSFSDPTLNAAIIKVDDIVPTCCKGQIQGGQLPPVDHCQRERSWTVCAAKKKGVWRVKALKSSQHQLRISLHCVGPFTRENWNISHVSELELEYTLAILENASPDPANEQRK